MDAGITTISMTALLAHPYYPASPVRPIRGYYYLMSNKRHTGRMSYVIFFPTSLSLLLVGYAKEFRYLCRSTRGRVTNSGCKSSLIVVDVVGHEFLYRPRMKIVGNARNFSRKSPRLRNEILINYPANQPGLVDHLDDSPSRHDEKIKRKAKDPSDLSRYSRRFEEHLIVRWCYR